MKRTLLVVCLAVVVPLGCARKEVVKQESTEEKNTPVKPEVKAEQAPIPASAKVVEQILLKLRRIHFSFDSVKLHPDIQAALQDAAEQLKKYPDLQLFVEGHADDRGTTEYNMALSDRRARVVVDYLARMGIKKDNLVVVPKGEENPLDQGTGAIPWARNRVVLFQLKAGSVQLELIDGVLLDDSGSPISSLPAESGS